MDESMRSVGAQDQHDVLIAIDGSLSSQIAATLAAQIAKFQHLNIQGLYVINQHYLYDNYANLRAELGPIDPPSSRNELAELLQIRGEMAIDWLASLCRSMNLPFRYEIVYGYVADEIAQRSSFARLAAFGKKGFHQPDDRSHLGENFHKFFNHIHVPYVAGEQELRPIRKILLGYNGGQTADSALHWAKEITRAFEAKLYVAYVNENHSAVDLTATVEQKAQENLPEGFDWIPLQGDVAEQLAKTVQQKNIDLLIVGCCQHPGLSTLLKGSTLDRLFRTVRATTLVS